MTLIELMKKIAGDGKCQLCSHEDWTIWHDDDTHDNPTVEIIDRNKYHSLSCNNCGNTVFLRKNIIDKRMKEVE